MRRNAALRPPLPLARTPFLTNPALLRCSSARAEPRSLCSSRSTPPPPPPPRLRRVLVSPTQIPSQNLDLRRLTSRVVELTRRRQLRQIFKEVDMAKRRYRKLNVIVMNAVVEACVHCGEVDAALRLFKEMAGPEGCGVDCVTYGTLLKGLGEARRVDDAFQILETIEKGSAAGNPKLSSRLIYGLLNALLEAGDMRRANGLLARYRHVLLKEGTSILLYNLLIKGYTHSDFPLGALSVRDEILRQGLKPDKLTYNTLLFACVKSGRMDVALGLFSEMKEEAIKAKSDDLAPDSVTYTTLLKGFEYTQDLHLIEKIILEIKSLPCLVIDRVTYTAMVDAMLACGSIKGALCIFGEILKQIGKHPALTPKPHLYLSMMREFASRGNFDMVKKLHVRMWLDSVGSISSASQREADELLLEAATNDNQVYLAKQILSDIIKRRKWISWRSRAGMAAIRLEAFSGFSTSMFNPHILNQVSLDDPVDNYMVTFKEAKPLLATLYLRKVVMRFYRYAAIPVIDDWGNCVGIVHREDCQEMDAPLSSMMRAPPPCVTTSTSVGRVIQLILERKYRMVIIVKSSNIYETSYNSSSPPVGVFGNEQLFKLSIPITEEPNQYICST